MEKKLDQPTQKFYNKEGKEIDQQGNLVLRSKYDFEGGYIKKLIMRIGDILWPQEARPAYMKQKYKGGFINQGQPSLVGELGPELIIPKSDVQVYSANRTEQMLDQALNRMMYGGGGSGGGGNTIISPVNNVANNTTSVSNPISIADIDPVLNRVTSYAI